MPIPTYMDVRSVPVDPDGAPLPAGSVASPHVVSGPQAIAQPAAGNPVAVGGRCYATKPVTADGARAEMMYDVRNNLWTRIAASAEAFAPGYAVPVFVAAASSSTGAPLGVVPLKATALDNIAPALAASQVTRLASAAASKNITLVKASSATLFRVVGENKAASTRYLHVYNRTTAPDVGVDAPLLTLPLQAQTPFNHPLSDLWCSAGAYVAITTDVDGATAVSAGDVVALGVVFS